jgi:transcriptional regulator with XRE-family HTH domain
MREMSQADFARAMGVSRAAVSQWKAKDILQEDAFTQDGKKGKVRFEVAVDQVRRNRDIGQSLGNGIATRTTQDIGAGAADPAPRAAAAEAPAKFDSVEDQLKRAKLEEQLRRNRMQAAEEAQRAGQLMEVTDAREQMARIAVMMLQIFEGALPDFAAAMAEKFDVPQRDVLHLMRSQMVEVRRTAAMKERARADAMEQGAVAEIGEGD